MAVQPDARWPRRTEPGLGLQRRYRNRYAVVRVSIEWHGCDAIHRRGCLDDAGWRSLDRRDLDHRVVDRSDLDRRTLDRCALDWRVVDWRHVDRRTMDRRSLDGRNVDVVAVADGFAELAPTATRSGRADVERFRRRDNGQNAS